jgi:hypothetical protein
MPPPFPALLDLELPSPALPDSEAVAFPALPDLDFVEAFPDFSSLEAFANLDLEAFAELDLEAFPSLDISHFSLPADLDKRLSCGLTEELKVPRR